MIRELIKRRLTEPHLVPSDKKMTELVDEIAKQRLSMFLLLLLKIRFFSIGDLFFVWSIFRNTSCRQHRRLRLLVDVGRGKATRRECGQ